MRDGAAIGKPRPGPPHESVRAVPGMMKLMCDPAAIRSACWIRPPRTGPGMHYESGTPGNDMVSVGTRPTTVEEPDRTFENIWAARTRTWNLLIQSQTCYQLHHSPKVDVPAPAGRSPARRGGNPRDVGGTLPPTLRAVSVGRRYQYCGPPRWFCQHGPRWAVAMESRKGHTGRVVVSGFAAPGRPAERRR